MRQKKKRKLVHKPFLKVKGRMAELEYTHSSLAEELNMAVSTLNEKINGIADFRLSELVELVRILDIKPEQYHEYFFAKELRIS